MIILPLILLSTGERQRPWLLSLLPSRMGMGMAMTTLPHFSGIEGQRPWPLLKRGMGIAMTTLVHFSGIRGMGMAMTTLLTFSGIGGQRSWPFADLPFHSGKRMTMTPLILSSRGEWQRQCPPALPSLPPRRGVGMAMASILLLSGVEGKMSWPIAYLP